MEVSSFFTRLLQTPKQQQPTAAPDSLQDFDRAWLDIKETLERPDERQLVRGITSTQVPNHLRHIVDALVYESNRTDEEQVGTGACLEYFLKNDILANLEKLCERDRPHGIKAEVLKAINNLVVLLSERFLIHNAVHRPLRRLLRSCIGDEPEEKVDGGARVVGAAGMSDMAERRAGNEDIEGDLVDLMCVLCSKMRAYPPLLLIFFHDKGWLQPGRSTEPALDRVMSPTPSTMSNSSTKASTKAQHTFEFLLFSYLLRFVHREGRLGDFARAGLIFLFDIAFLTANEEGGENLSMGGKDGVDPLQDARDVLGEFILDGDFADVMAAALGAVYSMLPTKLRVPSLASRQMSDEDDKGTTSGGMFLGSSLTMDEDEEDMPSFTDEHVQFQLDLLLKLFGFLQDIIHRCNSPLLHADPDSSKVSTTLVLGGAIVESTLDAIQSSFLDNVLYPAVLECSSLDGSSVAILTYLDAIFSNVDDGPVLDRIVSFLMDTNATGPSVAVPAVAPMSKKEKRKTGAMGFMGQLNTTTDYFAAEGRFTLKDLILDNLRADDWAATSAALRLLHTLFSEHSIQSTKGLLSFVRDSAATALARKPIPSELNLLPPGESLLPQSVNFVDIQLQETGLYGSLLSHIDPSQGSIELSPGFAGYLTDMQSALEANPSYRLSQYRKALPFIPESEKARVSRHIIDADPIQHRLSPSDPLLRTILHEFERFLEKIPDQNLAMTGVLTSLALCPERSLAGWMLYDKSERGEVDPWAKVDREAASESSLSDADSDSDDSMSEEASSAPNARASLSLPALYQVLRSLTKQLSYIRSDILEDPDLFDRLLAERRQGLLFKDHLDEAMNVMLDVDTFSPSTLFGSPAPGTPNTPSTPQNLFQNKLKPRTSGLASSIKSFLTPKKKTPGNTPSGTPGFLSPAGRTPSLASGLGLGMALGDDDQAPETPPKDPSTIPSPFSRPAFTSPAPPSQSAAPFKSHYDQTLQTLSLSDASSGEAIVQGPWAAPAPSYNVRHRRNRSVKDISMAGDDAFTQTTGERDEIDELGELSMIAGEEDVGEEQKERKQVSLSMVLDNCVILEEFLKEVVAVVVARRSIGVDQVGYI
ncbi:hypothetical protein L202_02137 [Cryptococcus amylolentus CBS 6039]|uniref:FHF complex subunit HOOK-interacting protein C-terminal domain-containing protein n=2 Tax=Cryptococcus amylolentus TaxID=104669 RepID=A0A1E3I1P6_9TREE|nr:hypothetical protein L202_02137 [Cryptococcus amylolentus CBS 6039]ODN81751.1 hypothetical protein L202_02137 [Cryptococcus amylolentus CBS 6039]ODO10057.1 hypothetical protein I350_02282 [Cryptococcus amylolentus CBS 6273]